VKIKEKYNERDVWTKYHLACTQLPRAFHLLQHNNQLDSPVSCASLSQLQLPLPDQSKPLKIACIARLNIMGKKMYEGKSLKFKKSKILSPSQTPEMHKRIHKINSAV